MSCDTWPSQRDIAAAIGVAVGTINTQIKANRREYDALEAKFKAERE